MKINTESSVYTFIYSVVLVVAVAAILAVVYSALKPKQDENIALEKKQTILKAAGLGLDASKQADKTAYINDLYRQHIVSTFVLNAAGDTVSDADAFTVNLKSQYETIRKMEAAKDSVSRKALESKLLLPVFVCSTEDAGNVNIYPCYGAGLWGPIWGYIAVQQDCDTVYGAVFDHEGESWRMFVVHILAQARRQGYDFRPLRPVFPEGQQRQRNSVHRRRSRNGPSALAHILSVQAAPYDPQGQLLVRSPIDEGSLLS